MHKQEIKKKICKCGRLAPGLPNYITKKNLRLTGQNAVEISYYSERLKIRRLTPKNGL